MDQSQPAQAPATLRGPMNARGGTPGRHRIPDTTQQPRSPQACVPASTCPGWGFQPLPLRTPSFTSLGRGLPSCPSLLLHFIATQCGKEVPLFEHDKHPDPRATTSPGAQPGPSCLQENSQLVGARPPCHSQLCLALYIHQRGQGATPPAQGLARSWMHTTQAGHPWEGVYPAAALGTRCQASQVGPGAPERAACWAVSQNAAPAHTQLASGFGCLQTKNLPPKSRCDGWV